MATTAMAGQCEPWSDENTYGYHCWGYAEGQVRATALCKDGSLVFGQWRSMKSGEWSYAYCVSGGGLASGQPGW
ncbi:hypothetical protein AB0M05_35325 [Streptomyces violaceusniger]|uniref:hypothetical protein n=1 Tax=Streptomyces violaceusniger TaxID=68280 RepID=UPI00343C83CF